MNGLANANQLAIVTEPLAPFQIVDKDSIGGLSTEIVTATLNATSYHYTLDVHPWSVAYKRATEENNTCIFSLARLPIRETQFQWIGHIASGTSSFYALDSRKEITIQNVEEAKRFRTAVIKDDITHQFLLSKHFIENQNLYATSNYDALLTLLEVPSRNIDLVIINDDLMHYRLGELSNGFHKYHNLLEISELNLDFHLACSLDTAQEVVNELRKTMNNLEKDGTFIRIREKWRPTMINKL
jgi:polar amino acid transport system substrate-binding protein